MTIRCVELILDEKGKKELDKLWTEFDFYASHTARTFIQFYFNQAGEVQGGGSEAGLAAPGWQGSDRLFRDRRSPGSIRCLGQSQRQRDRRGLDASSFRSH